jgi:1-acyl-sn-glycerol-3-phosphate acyltransferase
MPPAVIRRPITVTVWLLLSVAVLVLSPLLLAAAALLSALTRRPQPLLATRLVIAYLGSELVVLLGAGGLWLVSGLGGAIGTPLFQRLHVRLLRWFVHRLARRVLTLLDLRVEVDLPPDAAAALRSDRPLLFFSRHAGPGDTLLLVDLLLCRYERTPSVVFKEALVIDPCVDLMGHRLPHAILDLDKADEAEARIAEVAAGLRDRGVLVLFPEGGNFTPERRHRALRSLWRRGRRRELAAGREMTHMMPPHPAGALAALAANPQAGVLFSAHTGLGLAAFPRDMLREAPFHRTLTTRMWLVGPEERPTDPEEQAKWLYDWWKRLDAWVESKGEESPVDPEASPSG